MAVSLVGGALLGAAVGELLKAVLEAKDRISKFKDILTSIESTLNSIKPRLDEIIRFNNRLDAKQREMKELIDLIKKGKVLVLECCKISRFSFWKKGQYYKKLCRLQSDLQKYFMMILPLDQYRDNKEMMVMMKEMHLEVVGDRNTGICCKSQSGKLDEDFGDFLKEFVEMYRDFKNEFPDSYEDSEVDDSQDSEEGESVESDPEEEDHVESCQSSKKEKSVKRSSKRFSEDEESRASYCDSENEDCVESYRDSKKGKSVKRNSKKYSEDENSQRFYRDSEDEDYVESYRDSKKGVPPKRYSKKYSEDEEFEEPCPDSEEEDYAESYPDSKKEKLVKRNSKKYFEDEESVGSYQHSREKESVRSYRDSNKKKAATSYKDSEREDPKSFVTYSKDNMLMWFDRGHPFTLSMDDLFKYEPKKLCGMGTFGTTYKHDTGYGVFAVKRSTKLCVGQENFEQEMAQIKRYGHQHPNLVPLLGYYYNPEESLLIYKYAPKGSLDANLHGDKVPFLSWGSRVKICLGAAKGISHLHSLGEMHCNIKSTNVLLTQDLDGCIADYCLYGVIVYSGSDSQIAFESPELHRRKQPDQKSDVYSFGILLYEIITGKGPRPTQDLGGQIRALFREKETYKVFDPKLCDCRDCDEGMEQMLDIAMQCLEKKPERRPTMNDVVRMMKKIQPTH